MNPVTTWRVNLVALLKTAFPDADVASGKRDTGISRDKDRIRVFWAQTPTDANVNYARPQLTVRYWVTLPKISVQLKEEERDDTPLEEAGWKLAATLMPARTTLLDELYFELAGIVPVRDEFAIEAQLLGYAVNPAAIG